MQLQDIHDYYSAPKRLYLVPEQAACYALSELLHGPTYFSELLAIIEGESQKWRVSDTVMLSAIKFLEDEKLIEHHWEKGEGRGRPRKMLKLTGKGRSVAKGLAQYWEQESDLQDEGRVAG